MGYDNLDKLRFGVATASLGMHANHTLENRFAAIQKAGFKYCELGFGGYVEWVRKELPNLPASTCPAAWGEGGEPDPTDDALWEALYSKAEDMKKYAASFGLTILALQPLNQFEAWPLGHERDEWSKRKAEKWLPLCAKLGVELLQVGSNNEPEANAPFEKVGQDLRWLAELGAKQSPVVKIAYESWCFSPRIASWEDTWKVVQLGDHPNLGLCLDTAHFPLAPEYGWDPLTGEGWTDAQYKEMLGRLSKVPGDKIFYVELSDVLTPHIPLGKGSDFDEWREKAQSPRGDRFVWAVCGRPVPFVGKDAGRSVKSEKDLGGARVLESVKTILDTGFRGPMLYEVFEAISMESSDVGVSLAYTQACAESEKRLIEALKA